MTDQPPAGDGAESRAGDTTSAGPAGSGGVQAPSGPGTPKPEERGPTEQPITKPEPGSGPFEYEEAVMSEGVVIRDDISATQAAPSATRDVSSTHIARLLYQPVGSPGGPVYQSQAIEQRLRARRR